MEHVPHTHLVVTLFHAQLLFGLLAKGVSAADPATSHQMLTQVLAVLCNIGENSEAAINTIMQVRCESGDVSDW